MGPCCKQFLTILDRLDIFETKRKVLRFLFDLLKNNYVFFFEKIIHIDNMLWSCMSPLSSDQSPQCISLLTSYIYFFKFPMYPITAAHLSMGVGPSTCRAYHNLKEELYSPCHLSSAANSFSARAETTRTRTEPCWDFNWVDFLKVKKKMQFWSYYVYYI